MEVLGKFRGDIVDIVKKHNDKEIQIYDRDEIDLKKFEKLFIQTEEY